MVDHGKLSTILITIVGALTAAIIADPYILQTLLGSEYTKYGAAILAIIVTIYNAYFPLNPATTPVTVTTNTTITPEDDGA
jgi:hypothetical protein